MTRVPFTQNHRWHLPLLLLVFCCSFFINNGAIFADIMESRNIITAREMVYDHNWLVPTMNGELRLEKPPLPTWIAAITEMISPDNLPLQRAMAGFAAVMLVLFFYKFATKLTDNRTYALVSSLVLCTSYNIILMGRTATWDIYCHAFMMGAIYYLYLALRQNPCKWTYFIGAGIFMGLSFLGKGPVSFYALLLPFVCAYILYYRKETQMKGKWIALAVMILIGIVLSTWWYAYIYIYHQEMASYVFHKESSSWSNHNVRSWYYYWQFFLETGVWSLLTLTTLLVPFWKKRVESSKEYLFCLSWMLLILFFLSLLPEKKTRYLLPILLPAALTMGHLFVYWIRQAKQKMPQLKDRVLYRINAYLIVVAALALPIALYLFMYREGRMGTGMFVWLVVLFLTVAVWLFRSAFKLQPFSFLMGIVALFAVGLFNKTVSGLAARIALLVHVVLYFSIVWVFNVKINFVYVMGGLFVFDVVLMLILGQFLKREPYVENTVNKSDVDLTNWKYIKVTSVSLILGLIALYAFLSPVGIASPDGNPMLVLEVYAVLQLIVLIVFRPKNEKSEH